MTNRARTAVREAIDRAKAKFPEDAEEPFLNEFTTADEAVIAINFAGQDVPERVLFELASALKDELEALPEVLEANLSGQREELLEAVIEPTAMEHYSITMGEVASAVIRNNRLIAAGSIDTGVGRFSVKVPSLIENAQDLFDIPVKTVNGNVITVADVASVHCTFKDRESYARVNGVPSTVIGVMPPGFSFPMTAQLWQLALNS